MVLEILEMIAELQDDYNDICDKMLIATEKNDEDWKRSLHLRRCYVRGFLDCLYDLLDVAKSNE